MAAILTENDILMIKKVTHGQCTFPRCSRPAVAYAHTDSGRLDELVCKQHLNSLLKVAETRGAEVVSEFE